MGWNLCRFAYCVKILRQYDIITSMSISELHHSRSTLHISFLSFGLISTDRSRWINIVLDTSIDLNWSFLPLKTYMCNKITLSKIKQTDRPQQKKLTRPFLPDSPEGPDFKEVHFQQILIFFTLTIVMSREWKSRTHWVALTRCRSKWMRRVQVWNLQCPKTWSRMIVSTTTHMQAIIHLSNKFSKQSQKFTFNGKIRLHERQ